MEEDIKLLEQLIEEHKKLGDTSEEIRISQQIFTIIIQAIKNLISRNKELEEKRKTTMEVIGANYIHKDKVREKIEEYNKMINATYGDITHQGDIRRDNCIEIRNILEEILQEGDK